MSGCSFAPDQLVRLALGGVHREYPNQLSLGLRSEADLGSPRALTPAFYGCYDWHSAVHSHWTIVRGLRLFSNTFDASVARAALNESLTEENIAGEVRFMAASHRRGWERPYGLAWLLTLDLELAEWDDSDARKWSEVLAPLTRVGVQRLSDWLAVLPFPIRSGEHAQTAFGMGLALDWAIGRNEAGFEALLRDRARAFHVNDRDASLHREPSGHDFLSPVLGEADLMRRVLAGDAFSIWLSAFLPSLADGDEWLMPARSSDRRDGKLAHLDGLNLSRAWMLDGIADGLATVDPRRDTLARARDAHVVAAESALGSGHYELDHWIGTFAMYFLSRRGVAPKHDAHGIKLSGQAAGRKCVAGATSARARRGK